jgi:amidohydrolase
MSLIDSKPTSRFIAEGMVRPDRRKLLAGLCACCTLPLFGSARALAAPMQPAPSRAIHAKLDRAAQAIEQTMIAWRRDIHTNPELGNQEKRTAALISKHLKHLGYEVREGVARTGIVAVLRCKGGPGPVVALRADMDALPVTEQVDLPFASKVRAMWGGEEVGVAHVCGHDCHTAILMAAAEVLARNSDELRGTVKLIFQPAEEGLLDGEIGGARLMVDEGALSDPKPDAMFGLHVGSAVATGSAVYRAGITTAGADMFRVLVRGRQTHGAFPWAGVDPIAIGSAIVSTLQTIVSRESDVVQDPAVLSVGVFRSGVRDNIIPEVAELRGTLRTFSDRQRDTVKSRVKDVADGVARSMRGSADVRWLENGYPSVSNNTALTERLAPTLARVYGHNLTSMTQPLSIAEDFSYFAKEVPSFFYFVGVTPTHISPTNAAPNHSPRFYADEAALIYALRSTLHLVADFTES